MSTSYIPHADIEQAEQLWRRALQQIALQVTSLEWRALVNATSSPSIHDCVLLNSFLLKEWYGLMLDNVPKGLVYIPVANW